MRPYSQKPKSKTCTPPMSADLNTPLFVLSDNDDIEYEDDPAVTQAKANLAVAEHIQQEKVEQRRLEREEWKVRVEAEHLTKEIEEVERKWRELKEAELEQLTREKERLEEEKWVEQQPTVTLHGSERAAERRNRSVASSRSDYCR